MTEHFPEENLPEFIPSPEGQADAAMADAVEVVNRERDAFAPYAEQISTWHNDPVTQAVLGESALKDNSRKFQAPEDADVLEQAEAALNRQLAVTTMQGFFNVLRPYVEAERTRRMADDNDRSIRRRSAAWCRDNRPTRGFRSFRSSPDSSKED
ncbi:MAG TPA: hypothetical protein VLA92_00120 [Candidatus Saccharimonadales bacterium]|nr:hypothetical protein [Candidatus Saccharimonadales bacterium]